MTSVQERLQAKLADRYSFERELGRGGMATVFLAKDLKHDREVAIKVLHPDLGATIGADRFEREIKLAAKLQHPHILGLFDSGEADGLLYYVMPFVKGESLRDRLDREGQLPIDDAVQIILEVADALGYAHAQGIVHRDIKPENVLLAGGHALVADFGIARAISEGGGQKLTQTGMAVGTPVYMAPEQAMGDTVGPTTDLYSLGCMLFELLAGEPPFTAKNAHALMARHAMEAVPSIRIIRGTVPEEVEDAIFASMAKVPADRPQTAAQFAEILGAPLGSTSSRRASIRATASRRVPTVAQAPAYQAAPTSQWRRTAVIIVGVLVTIGGGVVGWRLLGGKALPPIVDPLSKRVAVLYFEDRSPNHDLRPVADGLTEALIKHLGEARTISVVSRNGVRPYRGTDTKPDSIALAVQAGTLVWGSVEPVGKERIRVTTRLFDKRGDPLGQSTGFEVPRDRLFAAEDSVAAAVSITLRKALGAEIQLPERRARATNLAAWTLLKQAENNRKDAEATAGENPAAADTLLDRADSLLAQAEGGDGDWADPMILRGEIALQHARLKQDPADRDRLMALAKDAAARALKAEPNSAAALALRGSLAFAEWRINRTADPLVRGQLLKSARADLELATLTDPNLASGFAQLSFVYYADKTEPVSSALGAARKAYEADAYLSIADLILERLWWSSYDTDQFTDADRWCRIGRERFPRDMRFAECQLWLLLQPNGNPDIGAAWRIKARVDSLASPDDRPLESHLTQLIVGGVIGMVGKALSNKFLADSADRVLKGGRAGTQIDPRQELLGYEAIMRAQAGQEEQAVALLKRYVDINPDHSFKVGDNVHWWWRNLQNNPGFKVLLSRR